MLFKTYELEQAQEDFTSQHFISNLESSIPDFDFGKIEKLRTATIRKLMTEKEKLTIIEALSKQETIKGLINALTKVHRGESVEGIDIDFINLLRYPSIINKIADIIGRKDIWDKRIIGIIRVVIPEEEGGKYNNIIHPTRIREKLKEIYGKYKYSNPIKK